MQSTIAMQAKSVIVILNRKISYIWIQPKKVYSKS